MKTFFPFVLCLLLILPLLNSCDKDDASAIDDSEWNTDFAEDMDDGEEIEFAGDSFWQEIFDKLIADSVIIEPDTISDVSARAVLIHRGDAIWKNIRTTKYVHSDDKEYDESKGVYKYDCSGFVYHFILKEVLKDHASDLYHKKLNWHPLDYSVRAWTFYDYFRNDILGDEFSASNEYWKVFTSVDSLKKGDLIIARYDDDWREKWKALGNKASTGHVMIAWDIGTEKDNEISIQVYDCSSSGHSIDTRWKNIRPVAQINEDSEKKSGIGFGWMKFKISTLGDRRPYAYKWKLGSENWYNLWEGDHINEDGIKYDRIKGIVFARPL
ncbi:MAG: hypothetical protein JXB19_11665 [Bacteroidales bacterium]|nr:hypothetical protein [Bacteroidales bacterium]